MGLLCLSKQQPYLGTKPSNFHVSTHRACSLILTHSSNSDIKPVHNAMGSEEITLTWLLWHAVSHIFQYLEVELTVNVTFVFSAVFHRHIHRNVYAVWVVMKRALCVSITPGFCFLHGLRRQWVSLLVVLMWRDDTCGSWIEHHKGFQIGNMEWWWAGVVFLLFILPRSILWQTLTIAWEQCSYADSASNKLHVSPAACQSATHWSECVICYI